MAKSHQVSAPAAISQVCVSGQPVIQTMAGNRTRVQHREMVGTFTVPSGTSGFWRDPTSIATPGYDGNPSNSFMFPWLSTIANSYERYRFRSLKIDLISSQASTASGRVYMAWDYDYDDPPAGTKQGFMSNRLAKEGGVWMSLGLSVDCVEAHRDMAWKYCTAAHRSDPEPRTAYIGYLLLGADTGSAVAVYNWDLWVTYDVEFELPCLDIDLAGETYSTAYAHDDASLTTAVTGSKGARELVFTPLTRGRARLVEPGSGATPAISLDDSSVVAGLGQAAQALDLSQCKLGDAIQFGVETVLTGSSPAQQLAQNPMIRALVYDWAGTFLGDMLSTGATPSRLIASSGPQQATSISTVGSLLRTLLSFDVELVKSSYKTARYVCAVLYTASALGAGTHLPYVKTW